VSGSCQGQTGLFWFYLEMVIVGWDNDSMDMMLIDIEPKKLGCLYTLAGMFLRNKME
jgi:hypothetical protein